MVTLVCASELRGGVVFFLAGLPLWLIVVCLWSKERKPVVDYSKLTVPELLEEEEKAQRKRNLYARDTNTWRQLDAKIQNLLDEMARRASKPESYH